MSYTFTPYVSNKKWRVTYETNKGMNCALVVAKDEREVKRIVEHNNPRTYVRGLIAVPIKVVSEDDR